ncbi:uncharacterized protein LOC126786344 isoform X2 [Argentina anserina]|uniref:uncharacterized protein LOC126786344 isoform X2 n=1 Tax=Argentina anserina TaxID=57926 RepID=UPI00217649F3|nr:uncharacterized protein LOC126786344 isoform X2 [Potentilla anserina]
MAEYIWVINKESLIIKPAPKNSPLFLRMIVLMFAMVFGVYICSICLKQISVETMTKLENIKVVGRPPHETKLSDIPLMHYPMPETFSRRANISSIVQTLDKVYNLDWYSSASKNECSAATGFKWMLNQGLMDHHEEIVEYFNRRGVSAIFLFRRNLLRRMVSVIANSYDRYAKLLNGTHKAHVHSAKEADTLSKYKPIINCTKLITDLKEMELTAAKAIEYFNSTRHIVVYYEDIVKNLTVLKDVEEFLRLPKKRLKSHQVKIHNGPLADHIRNWDDVKTTLTGTPYEDFLHADY